MRPAAPLALEILVGVAILLFNEGEKERPVELLAFALHHPAIDQWNKDRAESLLADLKAKIPASKINMALERGKAYHLNEIVTELLAE